MTTRPSRKCGCSCWILGDMSSILPRSNVIFTQDRRSSRSSARRRYTAHGTTVPYARWPGDRPTSSSHNQFSRAGVATVATRSSFGLVPLGDLLFVLLQIEQMPPTRPGRQLDPDHPPLPVRVLVDE